jgi:tetratricopeptide (TPR) repeat protein
MINLRQYLNLIKEDHQAIKVKSRFGEYNSIPSKELFLNIDTASVKKMGFIPDNKLQYVTDRMTFTMKRSSMEKNTLMLLDLIANNHWERPIYFNHTSLNGIGVNLNQHVVQEGNCFRLMPIVNPNVRAEFINEDMMFENVMEKFAFREMNNPTVYYNEYYRNFALNHRSTFNSLAVGLINSGDRERAREVILRSIDVMPDEAIPFDYTNAQSIGVLFELGEKEKAIELAELLGRRSDEFLNYIEEYDKSYPEEQQKHVVILNDLARTLKQYGEDDLAVKYSELFKYHYQNM